jgi:hypothetical protein
MIARSGRAECQQHIEAAHLMKPIALVEKQRRHKTVSCLSLTLLSQSQLLVPYPSWMLLA